MRAENQAALRYILLDDIYLLQSDKTDLKNSTSTPVETQPADATPIATKQIEPVAQTPVLTPPVETKQPDIAAQTPVISALTQTPAPAYNYLGGNKKQFLILTNYTTAEFIAADHLSALQNILKRLEYGLDDVAIFNVHQSGYTIIDLVNYFKPEKLLILGRPLCRPAWVYHHLISLKNEKRAVAA
ncbi:hypothetical protein [Mucilaginibacter antarcticus]|uniref:hypothetical protein n=1 Tax=Mucilaginibacter antarcticus TaxID=1855725 RepID=UPI0036261D08